MKDFFESFLGALVGAFIGTFSAWFLANKYGKREEKKDGANKASEATKIKI